MPGVAEYPAALARDFLAVEIPIMAGISFSALSKSKRRLLVSLTAVAIVAALGGVGIWQLQTNRGKLAKGEDPKSAKASDKSRGAKAALKDAASSDSSAETGAEDANESSPAAGALDEQAGAGATSSRYFRAKPKSGGAFDGSSRFSPMPSPQETVVRGNGTDGGTPNRPTSRFVGAEQPVDEASEETSDEDATNESDDPSELANAPPSSPFGRRLRERESDDEAVSEDPPSSLRRAPHKPRSNEQFGAEERLGDSEEATDEVPDEGAGDLAETESAEGQDAAEAVDASLADLAESEEESASLSGSSRVGLGAPVELDLGDAKEIPARRLRGASDDRDPELGDAETSKVATDTAAEEALAVPGPRHLEGSQTPMLTIEKLSPAEVQVNRPAMIKVLIRNVGQVAAQDVMVFDQVPQGARLEDTSPPASQGPDGSIVWQLGDLAPGEQAEVTMRITPETEGELGSVAKVAFQAQATSRSISTRPQLTIKQTAPARVLIGQQVQLSISISNPGSGAAENVVLEETLPEGLAHPAGRELEYEIGLLRPGETRSLDLTLTADKAGEIENVLVVRGAGELVAEDRAMIEVIAPQLDVAVKGPAKRYLQRPATYNIALLNGGTAPAKNVELVSYLPKGLKFLSANNQGRYDPPNHAVYWSLAELPAGAKGDVQVTAEPIEVGEQKMRVEGRADLGLAKVLEQAVLVEGLAELFYTVTDSADPIEVGADTIYQVRVLNQGSKVDTNVQLAVELPEELQPVAGEGPVRYEIRGQQVIFEALPRLGPQEEAVFKVQVKGLRDGDHKAKVVLSSDETGTPVSKEESTRVYAD